ncbi:MAG: hypothetical protein IT378_17515 [Sandaracinaceae bacterium]|nr:hypothetical protein [Sandaracinaceae bacterium]
MRRASVACMVFATSIATWAFVPATRAALPEAFGGEVVLPAPSAVAMVDPTRIRSSFEASLAEASFDGLYERRPDGRVVPVLAEGMPVVEGTLARIRLREGVTHNGGRPLLARHVVRELSPTSVEIGLARPDAPIASLLCASSLAIVIGGDLRRRPLGTGPYRVRLDGRGGAELAIFRAAPDGAPWIDRVRFVPPQARDEELRAFELGRLDGSWWGQSLYGGAPSRPATSLTANVIAPVLLVPNRSGVLRDEGLWSSVVRSIDRGRLERAGLRADRSLGAGLPAAEVGPWQRLPAGLALRMIVSADAPLEPRIAEALAGMLDEHGVRLAVERASASRYEAALQRSEWDLRLATVRPPLAEPGALVGAALAAAGQLDRARRVGAAIEDPEVTAQAARTLGAMVLGHERLALHHRADVLGLRFDSLGRLLLADASLARPPERRP